MSDRDDRLTVLIKGAAVAAEQRHRPVDVERIVGGRRLHPQRSVGLPPARTLRRVAVAAFVVATALGVAVGVRTASESPRRPPVGSTMSPLMTLEREYPSPIAIAVNWVEGHERGLRAAPTWLPPGATAGVTPYVTVLAAPAPGTSASWQLTLVRAGSGRVTLEAVPRGAAILAGFALTTYSSESSAFAAVSSITIRPSGPAGTARLGGGIVGYVHDAGPGGPDVYWLSGSWQLLVAGASPGSALRTARSLVAYLALHPLPSGPGVFIASSLACRAIQLLSDASATVSMPTSCDVTALARMTSSVRLAR